MSLDIIRGKIEKLKITRLEADFVFTDVDRAGIGGTAILAGLTGLGGAAIGLASSETREAADATEFDIGVQHISGWLWRCPFNEGDEVEVVGEYIGDNFETYAVTRPCDRLIALHPHCMRGTNAHKQNGIKQWRDDCIYKSSFFFLFLIVVDFFTEDYSISLDFIIFVGALILISFPLFFAYLNWRLTSRWMKFARLCDRIFESLGWENPKEVDLPARSKAQRKKGETWEMGAFYHRY